MSRNDPAHVQAIEMLRRYSGAANELHRLRDRVEELETILGLSEESVDRFIGLKLSPAEKQIVNILFKWKLAHRERIYAALYGSRLECDQPEIRTLDVHLHRIRKYLASFHIAIGTQRGAGWFLTEENREKLANLAARLGAGGSAA
ncbi:MAG: helix-turn-helix domain-containing protein [Bryobacteraceae bacterium]